MTLYKGMYYVLAITEVCNDGDLRLIGGSNNTEGRVEACYNEAWGTICDNSFDRNDATVICGQLGFSRRSVFIDLQI